MSTTEIKWLRSLAEMPRFAQRGRYALLRWFIWLVGPYSGHRRGSLAALSLGVLS